MAPQPAAPAPARSGRFTDRWPLRVTLVLALLTLVTGALLASGLTATTLMRGYLLERVDAQLEDASIPLGGPADELEEKPGPHARRPPSLFFVRYSAADGTPAADYPPVSRKAQGTPALPTLTIDQVKDRGSEPFTVDDSSGGADWRAIAVPLRNGRGTAIVAQSLADMDLTVQRLVGVEVAVGIILLVLLAGVGSFVVRRSLRGLEDVEHTAVAIAGGDLSRRVPDRDPRTEVGRLSGALNQMLGQIESAFAQRTASEAAARHSEESARRSEERMRRFVADASHELRTPLTSIRGFAELARQRGGELNPEEMRRIEEEAKRMGLLVDDLLLLARLDQQRPLARQPVDLLELAGDAVKDAQAVQPERAVRLEVLPGSIAPVVTGDEPRLRQVLGNLMSNALHHTPVTAPVTLAVGTADDAAVVAVRDSGPGLNDDQKARVFERFYRADSARTRATGGTGLGLSIVAALVAAHRGTVAVSDSPGGGATFTVRLPLAPA
ncbi:MAG TPA: HAMP domain-containing sensor histidine kinase [Kribbellaceae bacterium]|nr:HAMP domain-containing sensor histidine kinase [Kribbellaceae bacterium]